MRMLLGMHYQDPPSRRGDPAFQAWLKEGEPDFAHSALLTARRGRLRPTDGALPGIGHAALSARRNGTLVNGIHISLGSSGFGVVDVGKVHNEFDYTCALEIPLTENQFQTLLRDIDYYEHRFLTQRYSMFDIGRGDNCASFVLKMLKDVGVDFRKSFPTRTLGDVGIIPSTIINALERAARGVPEAAPAPVELEGRRFRMQEFHRAQSPWRLLRDAEGRGR